MQYSTYGRTLPEIICDPTCAARCCDIPLLNAICIVSLSQAYHIWKPPRKKEVKKTHWASAPDALWCNADKKGHPPGKCISTNARRTARAAAEMAISHRPCHQQELGSTAPPRGPREPRHERAEASARQRSWSGMSQKNDGWLAAHAPDHWQPTNRQPVTRPVSSPSATRRLPYTYTPDRCVWVDRPQLGISPPLT